MKHDSPAGYGRISAPPVYILPHPACDRGGGETTVSAVEVGMPSTTKRRRVEVPVALYEALQEVARKVDMPTNALAALWLWDHLEQKARTPGRAAEGIRAPQPYRTDGPRTYPRRDRRELPAVQLGEGSQAEGWTGEERAALLALAGRLAEAEGTGPAWPEARGDRMQQAFIADGRCHASGGCL